MILTWLEDRVFTDQEPGVTCPSSAPSHPLVWCLTQNTVHSIYLVSKDREESGFLIYRTAHLVLYGITHYKGVTSGGMFQGATKVIIIHHI